jgi:endonuclease YncB( thermonuclease family)
MVRNGMAYVPTGMAENLNVGAANDAKAAGTGLWTSCPGFGA